MKFKSFVILSVAVATLCLPTASQAGGPRYISLSGQISHWDHLVIHPETGTCGPMSNAETIDLLEEAILAWQDLPEVDFDYTIIEDELPDIDLNNYLEYVITEAADPGNRANATDSIIPIIFDDDGSITEALMGTDSQFTLVGLTSLNNFSDDDLEIFSEGQMILNCRCLEENPLGDCNELRSETTVSRNKFESVVVHEFGHLLNLDHSIANEDTEHVATMYPYVFDRSTPFEVSQDDIVAMATIYPSSTFADDYCLVTGTLLDSAGAEVSCANVVAASSDADETVTFVSGGLSTSFDVTNAGEITQSEDCTTNCGDFQLYLIPDTTYTLSITTIDTDFVEDAGVGPCRSEQAENVVAETPLATVTASSCAAGETVALGEITTNSESNGTALAQDSDDDDDDSSQNQIDTTNASGCSLSMLPTQHSVKHLPLPFWESLSFGLLFLLRFKDRFVKLSDLM